VVAAGRYPNRIKECLEAEAFLVTLEYVPERPSVAFDEAMRFVARNAELVAKDPRIRGLNIGDRVKSDHDHDTVEIGRVAAAASGKMPLLHLCGKDREKGDMAAIVRRALGYGLDTFLLITGDKVKRAPAPRPVRYHDSVNAIWEAKAIAPDCFVAAAVSPFKYREEELMNQYLKMAKKFKAGADYFITNCGWDMAKFQELIWYRDARGFRFPIAANLLILGLGWARGIHAKRLPGVHVTDDLLRKVEEECADPDRGEAARYYRVALQIVGVKHMGYAGVQVSGVNTYEGLSRVLDLASQLEVELPSLEVWEQAWREAHTFSDGRVVRFAPPEALYLFPDGAPKPGSLMVPPDPGRVRASQAEVRRYRSLDALDHAMFRQGSLGTKLLGPLMRGVEHLPGGRAALLGLERLAKEPLLGCQTCGFCRIPYTFYVCPETCPKGLANGPCSGTDDNVCEFKDRECIHNRKYRIAKSLGRVAELEDTIIPLVKETRGTCSWTNHYRGDDPPMIRLREPAVGPSPPEQSGRG
jgi:methylenetetrahydrofolate reductase (NADPH)